MSIERERSLNELEVDETSEFLIGYARVSTTDQHLHLQMDAMTAAGISEDRIYKEYKSGATTKRPEFEACLKALRGGDTLVVWRLDRLGRSLPDLIRILSDLKERGIKFRSLNEMIDTSSPMGNFIFHIFGAVAQFERDLISERTRAGLAAAKLRGHVGGRKSTVTPDKLRAARIMLEDGLKTHTAVFKALGISSSAYYRAAAKARDAAEIVDEMTRGEVN